METTDESATPMGGLEAHGKAMLEAAGIIAEAIGGLAEAVREAAIVGQKQKEEKRQKDARLNKEFSESEEKWGDLP